MRRLADLALLAAVLAGCAKHPSAGTELKLGPRGFGGGSDITVVLVDPSASMPLHQRTSPGSLADSDVVYYKQAVMVGAFDESFADLGKAVIELGPEPGAGTTHYVAFAIVGSMSAPTAIGTFVDSNGAPAAIELPPADSNTTEEFPIRLERVVPPSADGSIGAGQYELVTCGATNSGFVWHPMAGGELRVLLSDDGDALMRPLDLDCDNDTADDATAPDCDDTRASFYAGAVETCDGQDTNCDGELVPVATPCTPPDEPTCSGVRYCEDVANGQPQDCLPTGSCAASDAFTCTILDKGTGSIYAPCVDDAGQLLIPDLKCSSAAPCLISVSTSPTNWRTSLATTQPALGVSPLQAITVTTDNFWIEDTLVGQLTSNTSVLGEVDLAVERSGMPTANISVTLSIGSMGECVPVPTAMACSENPEPGQ